jgi:hypothetical protein
VYLFPRSGCSRIPPEKEKGLQLYMLGYLLGNLLKAKQSKRFIEEARAAWSSF